jgi:hypothetical protein
MGDVSKIDDEDDIAPCYKEGPLGASETGKVEDIVHTFERATVEAGLHEEALNPFYP